MAEIIRGGDTDEYHVYLYAKVDNDYRPTNESSPLHLWRKLDIGELTLTQYKKIIQKIDQLFEEKGFNKYLIDFHDTIFGAHDEKFLYLLKYGDEIPLDARRKLWKLNITPAELGETSPNISEYGIVIWTAMDNITDAFSFNPEYSNIQAGISVPAMEGGKRKMRRTRRRRNSAKRTRRHRRQARKA